MKALVYNGPRDVQVKDSFRVGVQVLDVLVRQADAELHRDDATQVVPG